MKKLKTFVSGLIVGMMIMGTVFATSDITATFSDFNFVINGQVQKVQTKPIVYNGTSYLPVREISNLLGYDVEFKADTRTIELNNTKEVSKVPNTITNTKSLRGWEILGLLEQKYPNSANTINLSSDGKLNFENKTYNLNLVSEELGFDITPLIEANILD